MYPNFERSRNIYINYHDGPHGYAPHFHHKLELVYCFEGCRTRRIGETLYRLKSGEVLVIFPNITHECVSSEEDVGGRSIDAVCKPELFTELLPDFVGNLPVSPLIPSEKVSENAVLAFHKMRQAKSEAELLGWILVVLSELLPQMELTPIKNPEGANLAPRIVSYINENFQKQLTIEHLARAFGYSESYITHIFYDQLKIPFRTCLGRVRAEHARNLICTTNKSLTEIAYECGFNTLNTFCRCFKKRYSITPSAYRKKARLGDNIYIAGRDSSRFLSNT